MAGVQTPIVPLTLLPELLKALENGKVKQQA